MKKYRNDQLSHSVARSAKPQRSCKLISEAWICGCKILFLALLGVHGLLPAASAGTTYMDNAVVSNTLIQTESATTNIFSGAVKIEQGLNVEGPLAVPKQGNVSMGAYTNGAPEEGAAWGTTVRSFCDLDDVNITASSSNTVPYWNGESLINDSAYMKVELSSRTIVFTNTMTSAEIQNSISSIGKYIPYGVVVTLSFQPGTYTLTNALTIAGFYGGGTIQISDYSGFNGTLRTTQGVTLDSRAYPGNAIFVSKNAVTVNIYDVHVKYNAGESGFFFSSPMLSGSVAGCYVEGDASTGSGIRLSGGTPGCIVQATYFSKGGYALWASYGINVYSYGNASTGTLPLYGLYASQGAIIVKNNSQPTGSTANELEGTGGDIRP